MGEVTQLIIMLALEAMKAFVWAVVVLAVWARRKP